MIVEKEQKKSVELLQIRNFSSFVMGNRNWNLLLYKAEQTIRDKEGQFFAEDSLV